MFEVGKSIKTEKGNSVLIIDKIRDQYIIKLINQFSNPTGILSVTQDFIEKLIEERTEHKSLPHE